MSNRRNLILSTIAYTNSKLLLEQTLIAIVGLLSFHRTFVENHLEKQIEELN